MPGKGTDGTDRFDAGLGRRRLLLTAPAVLAGISWPGVAHALAPTPEQARGPFYPRRLPADRDADLTVFEGRRSRGEVIEMAGRVLRTTGAPASWAVVEIWHCDGAGVYAHVGMPTDPAFQGYGAVRAGADGAYRFRTTRPGLYPGRTRHIHVTVRPEAGPALTTQMYFPGEPGSARDGLLRRTSASERLIAREEAGPPMRYVFDIVVS